MRYFIVKKEGINLPSAVCVDEIEEQKLVSLPDEGVDTKTNTNLDLFIAENIELIRQISPVDPAISKQDEWRTEDYSEYDKMRTYFKQRGKTHDKRNQSMGHMACRFSLRRKP